VSKLSFNYFTAGCDSLVAGPKDDRTNNECKCEYKGTDSEENKGTESNAVKNKGKEKADKAAASKEKDCKAGKKPIYMNLRT